VKAAWRWLGVFILLAIPKGAFMSGPFTGQWADQYYLIAYEEKGHKIFKDDQQARRYMGEYNQVFLEKAFLTLPSRLSIVERAKKRSISLQPLDPTLPRHDLKPGEAFNTATAPAYPALFSFPVDSENGVYQVTVSLKKPLDPGQVQWLAGELTQELQAPLERYRQVETELPDMQTIAASRVAEKFGVYACLDHQTPPGDKAQYQQAVERVLSALVKVMDQKIQDPEFLKALGSPPLPLKAEFDRALKAGNTAEILFRPHGPALDNTFPTLVSVRGEKGYVLLVVLLNLKDSNWGAVWGAVNAVLKNF
jgi:hypothetical protein